jgi:site-specific recombinase XerD
MITLLSAIESFLGNVEATQAAHTAKNYRADLLGKTGFLPAMDNRLPPTMPIGELREEMAVQYFQSLVSGGVAPATFHRRAASMREFLRFVDALQWAHVSADRLKSLLKAGKLDPKLETNDSFNELAPLIQRVIDHAAAIQPQGSEIERLIQSRNKAFVLTLPETGARVHEACKLKRSDIDWTRQRAVIIGKGGAKGLLRFGSRSFRAIQEYLQARATIDGATGLPLASLPVFARHDDGGMKKVKPITPSTGEEIVHGMALAALGPDYDPRVTCHKFRHYFVTMVLQKTDNLKKAQEMARHKSITNTQRYGHVNEGELDRTHAEIFSSQTTGNP